MKDQNHRNFQWLSRNNLIFFLGLFIGILIISCEKDPDPLISNSVINGHVRLNDTYDSYSNIKVRAVGPYGNATAFTDSLGHFSFEGLGNGTYSLEYFKEGYGIKNRYGLQLFGNDTIYVETDYIYKDVENFNVPRFLSINPHYEAPWGEQCISLQTDMAERNHNLAFFMDLNKNVSYKSYAYINTDLASIEDGGQGWVFLFHPYMLPFESGSTVYLIAYVCNEFELSDNNFDSYMGRLQLTTLQPDNHSEVMSFIMP